MFTQLATMIGQFGQAVAAVPFLALLVNAGWTAAWGSLAFLLVFSVLLVIAIVQDEPPGEPGAAPTPVTRPGQVLKDVFTSRAAWSGFFVHWMCLVSVNAFLFMWGVPYMTSLGIGSAEVGTLLTINVVIMVALGPLIGVVTGRFPRRRPLLGWIAGSVLTVTWAVTLLVPGPMTAWQLLPLITAMAIGSATCSVGFDLARTGVPRRAIGTATGMVNIGGYSASLVAVLLIGIVLDLRTGDGAAALADYRVALASGSADGRRGRPVDHHPAASQNLPPAARKGSPPTWSHPRRIPRTTHPRRPRRPSTSPTRNGSTVIGVLGAQTPRNGRSALSALSHAHAAVEVVGGSVVGSRRRGPPARTPAPRAPRRCPGGPPGCGRRTARAAPPPAGRP